ncbi:MAG: thioesterase family protein [Myxococcota bacterium]
MRVPAADAPTERPYRLPVRIYFEHTDALGIAYHSNYLNFFERARSEIIGLGELVRLREQQLGFVVYDASMRFKLPAKLGDDLEIRSLVRPMSAVRLRCWQDAYKTSDAGTPIEPQLLVAAVIDLAFIDVRGTPARLPEELTARFRDAAG